MDAMATKLTNYAEILPPLSTQEFLNLKADIKANGQIVPISVDEDGNVLDGWHRKQILGSKVKSVVVPNLSEAEKFAFAYRSNRGRRNMSPAQEKELEKAGKKIAFDLREQDKNRWTQSAVAAVLGVARSTVEMWYKRSNDTCVNPSPDARVKVNPKHKPIIAERVLVKKHKTIQVAADYKVSQRLIQSIVNAETKKIKEDKQRKAAAKKIKGTSGILHGDFREIGKDIKDASVRLIFTDPPYNKEASSLYTDLAEFANRVLIAGGWCLSYSGQAHLPEVISGMSEHLTYGWTFAVLHSGGDIRFRKFQLWNGWKPIVGFYKPPLGTITWDWFKDVVSGGKEKDDHEWQQALSEAEHFIQAMTVKGEVVCDPMCGSGTTLLAAKNTGRKWTGMDADVSAVEKARIKINDND